MSKSAFWWKTIFKEMVYDNVFWGKLLAIKKEIEENKRKNTVFYDFDWFTPFLSVLLVHCYLLRLCCCDDVQLAQQRIIHSELWIYCCDVNAVSFLEMDVILITIRLQLLPLDVLAFLCFLLNFHVCQVSSYESNQY